MALHEPLPELWHFPISHYCEKVRWALEWKDISHTRRTLGASYLPRVWWSTGARSTLPALRLDGETIVDSTAILAELERRWPKPALYPEDPALLERALALEDWFDEELGHAFRAAIVGGAFARSPEFGMGLFALEQGRAFAVAARGVGGLMRAVYRWRHEIDDETSRAGWERIDESLDRIERELGPSGFLVGERFGVADLTAVALLAPLLVWEAYLAEITGGEVPPELLDTPEWILEERAPRLARPGGRWVANVWAAERHARSR